MPDSGSRRLVDATELAQLLGVSVHRVYRWSSEGRIPKLAIGRWVRFDVDEVLAAAAARVPADVDVEDVSGSEREPSAAMAALADEIASALELP
jgi:excisionase family DNA binding protein